MTKILWFDIESGGLTTDHALLQLSGIVDINGKIVEEFDFYVKPFPNDIISDEALEITGIKREDIENFQDPIEVKNELFEIFDKFINKYDKNDKFIMAGHNIRYFDVPMLISWFKKCDEKYFGSYLNLKKKFDSLALIENMRILRVLEDSPNNKLEPLCNEYGITLENAHNSLVDVRATRDLSYTLGKLIKKNLKGDVFDE